MTFRLKKNKRELFVKVLKKLNIIILILKDVFFFKKKKALKMSKMFLKPYSGEYMLFFKRLFKNYTVLFMLCVCNK